jgi:antitoxin component of MazEF toxin-antitoxin module
MGYATKMQMIKRGNNKQWFVNFPAQVAAAIGFERSESVEWEIIDRETLKLKRKKPKKRSTL